MNGPDDSNRAFPRRWPVWTALLVWAALLVVWLGRGRVPDLSSAMVAHWSAMSGWIRGVAWRAVAQFLAFVPLGLLAVFCLQPRSWWIGRVLLRWLPGLALSFLLALVVLRLERHGPPLASLRGLAGIALAFAGCFVGSWAAMALARGIFATILFVPQLLLLTAALLGGTVYVIGKAVAPTAAAISMPKVGSAERRHLYDLFASRNPVATNAPSDITLRLAPTDLNLLVAWALSVKGSPAKMTFDLDGDSIQVNAAVPIQGRAGFVNLSVTGNAAYDRDALTLRLHRLRIGKLDVPSMLLKAASPIARELITTDERLRPMLARLRRLQIQDSTLAVTYASGALPAGLVSRLFHDTSGPRDDAAETRAQIANLLVNAKKMPRNSEARFGAAIQTAFKYAQDHSTAGRAVDENRAAVLALAIAIGHPDVETLMGDFLDPKMRHTLRAMFTGTTLRKRDDWPKHFFVSAALTVITGTKVSDASGLLKEEKDAAGGSGFSFADLLADRAGTMFATVATRNEGTARAFQYKAIDSFHVDDFFPKADGLPEGIQDADFQKRYGGVDGAGYRRLADDIDRRVAACSAYRDR